MTDRISQTLLLQRVRNKVIEVLELHASLSDVARFDAFEAVNHVDDWVPEDMGRASPVFSAREADALTRFMELVDAAAEATTEDCLDESVLSGRSEWRALSANARETLAIFLERGRFSEDVEAEFPTR